PNIGSVMDYNPSIISPRGKSQGSFTTRSIGPYDFWAIEYGYRATGKPYNNEEEMLGKIASRVAEPGLDYATDEDTMWFLSPDPNSNRFDCGRDVMEYARRQYKLTDSLLEDVQKWAVKDGQSFTKLRKAFMRVMGERGRAAGFVARFVGGQIMNRDHKADPEGRTPMVVVEAKKQRDALKFVCDNVFAENAYDISPDLLSHLAPGRYWHWGSDEFDFQVEFNIHDYVAFEQYDCLMSFMNPFTIARIHDNQVKFPKGQDLYTLNEHLTALTDGIWSELTDGDRKGTDAKPYINGYRRNLQRMQLEMLMNLVLTDPDGTVPADANAIARRNVERLSRKIGKVVQSDNIDETTLAHLTDVKKRIDKALEADYTINGFRGLSNLLMLFREAGHGADKTVPILPER
ncbi:MAG: zinc-dependent metalloprotease, partial [Planctomycetota bacterium]